MQKGGDAPKLIVKVQPIGSYRPIALPLGREPVKPIGSYRPVALPLGREPVKPWKVQP
jgi:hypothetical protein